MNEETIVNDATDYSGALVRRGSTTLLLRPQPPAGAPPAPSIGPQPGTAEPPDTGPPKAPTPAAGPPPGYLACAGRLDVIDLELNPHAPPAENNARLRYALAGGRNAEGPSLNGEPGRIRIPRGTFTLTGGLELASGQHVEGVSPVAGTALRLLGAGVLFSLGDRVSDARISGLRIEGWGAAAGTGIAIVGAERITILDVHFHRLAEAVSCSRSELPSPDARAHLRSVGLLVLEGCVFSQCGYGVRCRGTQAAVLLRASACAFECDDTGVSGAGLALNGENLSVIGCRFVGPDPMDGPARWRPIELRGRAAEVRYNLFDAPTPHVVTVAEQPGSDGLVLEHNVHLRGALDQVTRRALDTGVNRGGGHAQIDTGESPFNLLPNGSFEWWDELPAKPGVRRLHPVGWRVDPQFVGYQRLRDAPPRALAAVGFPRPVADPNVRHGRHALRLVARPGRTARLEAEPVVVDRGGPLTFACWIRMDATAQRARPEIRLVIQAAGFGGSSEPYLLSPAHAPTWQRLACTFVAPREARAVRLGVEVRGGQGAEDFAVDVDGASLQRGYLALDQGAAQIDDAGGEIFGGVEFAGPGAQLVSRLRVMIDGEKLEGTESMVVPVDCRLVGLSTGALGATRSWLKIFRGGAEVSSVRSPRVGQTHDVHDIELQRGSLVQIVARFSEATWLDVDLEFLVPRVAPMARSGPWDFE